MPDKTGANPQMHLDYQQEDQRAWCTAPHSQHCTSPQ